MELNTNRFGVIEFDEKEVLTFKEGLLGFPFSRRYLLFPYNKESPFYWLQSVDEPDVAFIVVNPFEFFNDLEFVIDDADSTALGLAAADDAEIFSLVTIPEGRPEEMRTNLAGLVVVNAVNRLGRQVLMRQYSPRQPLIPDQLKAQVREMSQGGQG